MHKSKLNYQFKKNTKPLIPKLFILFSNKSLKLHKKFIISLANGEFYSISP